MQFGHLFAKGDRRESAIRAMVVALKQVKIRGEIRTSVDYTTDMIQHEAFTGNNHHTGWLDSRIAAHVSLSVGCHSETAAHVSLSVGCLSDPAAHVSLSVGCLSDPAAPGLTMLVQKHKPCLERSHCCYFVSSYAHSTFAGLRTYFSCVFVEQKNESAGLSSWHAHSCSSKILHSGFSL